MNWNCCVKFRGGALSAADQVKRAGEDQGEARSSVARHQEAGGCEAEAGAEDRPVGRFVNLNSCDLRIFDL